jgi:hypothetical protein
MGHSTTRAALIYQHRATERDRFIAAALSEIIEAELAEPESPSGTQHADPGTHLEASRAERRSCL